MLNQAAEDRRILAEHLGINSHQLKYVTKAGEGQGLIFYGSVIVPFVDHFPKDTRMYRIMTTKLSETSGTGGSASIKKRSAVRPKNSGQDGSGSVAEITVQPVSEMASPSDGSNAEPQEEDAFEQMIKEVEEVVPEESEVKESLTEENVSALSDPVIAVGAVVTADETAVPEQTDTIETAPKRRRGRPSQKELEARRIAEESVSVVSVDIESKAAEDEAGRGDQENTESEAENRESEEKESTPALAPIKKKRGRPSKKEIAERKAAEEAQAAGQ